MIFSQDRKQLRQMYIDSWAKFVDKKSMTDLEIQIARVIEHHPEYHNLMNEDFVDSDYLPEQGQSNPFLHMGLHLSLIEQIATNRPQGIQAVYQQLVSQYKGDEHKVHHLMMDYLIEAMWTSQKYNKLPDEQAYLKQLQLLVKP